MEGASIFRNGRESVPGIGSRGAVCLLLVRLVEAAALGLQAGIPKGRSQARKDGNAEKREEAQSSLVYLLIPTVPTSLCTYNPFYSTSFDTKEKPCSCGRAYLPTSSPGNWQMY